jgi:hypothetical protein
VASFPDAQLDAYLRWNFGRRGVIEPGGGGRATRGAAANAAASAAERSPPRFPTPPRGDAGCQLIIAAPRPTDDAVLIVADEGQPGHMVATRGCTRAAAARPPATAGLVRACTERMRAALAIARAEYAEVFELCAAGIVGGRGVAADTAAGRAGDAGSNAVVDVRRQQDACARLQKGAVACLPSTNHHFG